MPLQATESGWGNAGTNLDFIARTDAGGLLSTPISIERATGRVSFAYPVKVPALTTAQRPAPGGTAGAGMHMFDTTLGKPTWYDRSNWRDACGTSV
ncbi:hypothetical protein [Arthrobacter sp. Bz4]|uniref:hypothetical protein n=1 Tax=Arthrobacter sp. Bz4 TaxID=2171979 RepID=UPI000D51CA37|nr:hypothetical protein [Arthrobacter sp. Bz4]PVE15048.1 hypothetical protein DDA93_15165 [Arthrobacter sp. Bz4]